jgi:hypothetical protein
MIRTIAIGELVKSECETWSVKDNSPRGCVSKSTSDVVVGDKVVINNYFHEVI